MPPLSSTPACTYRRGTCWTLYPVPTNYIQKVCVRSFIVLLPRTGQHSPIGDGVVNLPLRNLNGSCGHVLSPLAGGPMYQSRRRGWWCQVNYRFVLASVFVSVDVVVLVRAQEYPFASPSSTAESL